MKELLGDGPVLILLDELAVYLRKAERHRGAGKAVYRLPDRADQGSQRDRECRSGIHAGRGPGR